jgi:hypothetical protein
LETIKSKESKSLESTNEKHIRLLCQYSNTTYDIDINQVVGINSIRKTKGGSDIASNNDKEKEKFEKFFYECFYDSLIEYVDETLIY